MADEDEDSNSHGYPMYLYVYDENGRYGPKQTISNKDELAKVFEDVVAPTTRAGREVVIADCWDHCIYHAKDGVVVWPKEAVKKFRQSS